MLDVVEENLQSVSLDEPAAWPTLFLTLRLLDTLYALTIAVLPNTVCIIDFIIALKVCVFRVFANQVLRRVHFVSDHQRKFDAAGRQELG